MADTQIVLTVKGATAAVQGSAKACGDWVCWIDNHPWAGTAIGPAITAAITIFVAGSGWWWSIGKEDRTRHNFGRMAVSTTRKALEVADLMDQGLKRGEAQSVRNGRQMILESPSLGVLDQVAAMKIDRWPNVELYVAVRALRDSIHYMLDSVGENVADDQEAVKKSQFALDQRELTTFERESKKFRPNRMLDNRNRLPGIRHGPGA